MSEETPRPSRTRPTGTPTAPHATPNADGGPPTGPEKFWDARRVRVALAITLLLSAIVHVAMSPWSLFPKGDFTVHDVDGELTIPIDMIGEAPPEPPPPTPPAPPAPPPPSTPVDPNGAGAHAADASAPKPKDAGPDARSRDASTKEASADGASDARSDAGLESDASSDTDATAEDSGTSVDAGPSDSDASVDASGVATLADAAIARGDGGAPGGPKTPADLLGAVGDVQSGPPLVVLFVNAEVIRKHPIGGQLGPLLRAIPQWDDFMEGTPIDPVRDTDWILIFGPSLLRTDKDAIVIHYSAPDAVVDKAVDVVAKKYAAGGPFDAGVPGVKATMAHADRAERVILRPQSRVLVVVPPDAANKFAKAYQKAKVEPHLRPTEAMRLSLQNPHRPMPWIPESVTALRLWIVPEIATGDVDIFAEGDTPSEEAASDAAAKMTKVVRDINSGMVQLVTRGALDGAKFRTEGVLVRASVHVRRDQLESILGIVAAQLGVPLTPSTSPAAPPGGTASPLR